MTSQEEGDSGGGDAAAATTTATTPASAVKTDKVVILFKAVGNAPLLKLKKFQVTREATVQTVVDFLRKQLKYGPQDPLYVFINCAFQPAPDAQLSSLANCFETNGKLVVHYSTTAAWG
jgi:ubiquitin-like protein ATG12